MPLEDTIKPKSDQLNYDDVATKPLTVKVVGLKKGNEQQPVIIEIEDVDTGEKLQPFKPCKSMRRVLIAAWGGGTGKEWIGQSMTLYGDPSVVYAGQKVGGIRVSHVSGIAKPLDVLLTATRGKRAPYTVKPLQANTETADAKGD